MDEHNNIDAILEDVRPVQEFHKDLQTQGPAPKGAARSAADDVIDAVGDVRPARVQAGCPQCGCTSFDVRKPLSGSATYKCHECNNKWTGAPRSPSTLILSKIGTAQALTHSGPYYRDSRSLPDIDKNTPTSRRKARSYAALKKKAEER